MTMIADRLPVIDTDSHVAEPPDLWTSRLARKWSDQAPRIEYSDDRRMDVWVMGGQPLAAAWHIAVAGWKEPWPSFPPVQADVDPAAYDPVARARKLDEFGVRAQVLYPNLLGSPHVFLKATDDVQFLIDCVQAYNDFLIDFANAAPGRFIPIMALPFFDVEASVLEIERSAANGHKGILFGSAPHVIGLPRLRDMHWDPIFRAAQDAGLSINFHVGFGDTPMPERSTDGRRSDGRKKEPTVDRAERRRQGQAEYAKTTTIAFMSANSRAIAELIISGMCDRYPTLNFVSVESGFGYVPYLIETLDWQWVNGGAAPLFPERLKPSEYFRRQIHGTFWFEAETLLRLIDLYPDNMMFETDFPHPTCLAPGPASYTDSARNVIEQNLIGLAEPLLRKVLFENAARVYHLPESLEAATPGGRAT